MNRTPEATPAASADARYAAVYLLDNPFCIDDAYHYYIPPVMADAAVRGAFVTVPFGRGNRKQLGVVTAVCGLDELPATITPDRIKPVGGICRGRLLLSERQLSLCFYLKETTLCTMGEAVRTVVPPSVLASLVEYYRPVPEEAASESRRASLSAHDLMVLEYIRTRGFVAGQSIRSRFGARAMDALENLCDRGLAERELNLREALIPTVRTYALSLSREETEAALAGRLPGLRVTSAPQKQVLEALLNSPTPLRPDSLKLAAGVSDAPIKSLVAKGLLTVVETETYHHETVVDDGDPAPLSLSEEQASAVESLSALAATGEPRAALLHGVTGSGKTTVILAMIDRMLDSGRGVIVLLPEISLTPQMLHIFRGRYGRRVAVIHSGLSAGERQDSHRRILAGEAPVVVGTRSAVFAPVPQLGMIVMDEEQEHTYKSDMNPKYHARDIARFRCADESALLLLSSATPSLESYQKAMEGRYTLIRMTHRYGEATLPAVRIVDMRGEALLGNSSPMGQELTEELARVRSEGNQSVLFLNRRGYSHQLVCRSCGQAVTCPRCSVAMNLHVRRTGGAGELVCHWCGTRRPVPATCPDCSSPHLIRMGYGTQRVEEELSTLHPDLRVLRMDADTTSTKSAYHDLLEDFRAHRADVLLGTQMVTKGHDFPDVTLVGVLMADMSLYLDDYRASERTFSMLTQVIGRAGRADKPGLAVIQTMNPDHDILRLACAQDYETFFDREIRLRRLLQFPPFCDIVLLSVTSPDEKELQKACLRLSEELRRLNESAYTDVPIVAFGPFEAPVYRVDNVYRMRMVIKCRLNRRARAMFAEILRAFASTASRNRQTPVLSVDLNPSSI